jgi:hypothetical protein
MSYDKEVHRQQIIAAYIAAKMERNKVKKHFAYFLKLERVQIAALEYYNQTYGNGVEIVGNEMYQDEIEAAIIKDCATKSTSAAHKFSVFRDQIIAAFDQGVIAEFTHQVSGAPETSGQEYFNQTYGDGIEIVGKEMSYDDGYKQGYNRAIELTKWAISNLIPPSDGVQ